MIDTQHFLHLGGSPAELLVIEGMYETAKAGFLFGYQIGPENELVVAFEDGVPVAFIAFLEYRSTGELWIHLGYCKSEYRRQGHYKACIDKLKEVARERGYQRINTASHPDNKAAIASIMARGGVVQYIGFVFPV